MGRPWREWLELGLLVGTVVLLVVAGIVFNSIFSEPDPPAQREPAGVQAFAYEGGRHVEGNVDYAERPPVGGAHSGTWQDCGGYDAPVADERAVHSLEHGAVWIAYRPDLPEAQRAALRARAESQPYVLVSPYPGLPSPVVVSAWNRQLPLDYADDPRLDEFVRSFRLGGNAPEPGAPCTGGSSEAA